MADDALGGIHLGFFSDALKDDEHSLGLVGVDGREELSRPFEIELALSSSGDPLSEEKLAALVSAPCVIALGTQKTDIIHGALSTIEHVGTAKKLNHYRATLVPFTSLLGLGRRSAIYQETTVPEMISTILTSYGMAKGKDFQIHLANAGKSPKHEYIVQYQESDWDFVSRWLEHEGFFYYFSHTADGVGLHIADSNADAAPIEDPHSISYRDKSNLVTAGLSTVWSFHVRQRCVPANVTVVDYNHRRPLDMLISTKKVDEKGFGHVFSYGDHFKDKDVGAAWATIRAEELGVDRRVVSGTTDCGRFRVGHTFELEGHPFAEYDGKYLITSIEHSAGFAVSDWSDDFDSAGAKPRGYRGVFTAIPFKVPFRPKRTTPWPRINGLINGHIDSDTSGTYAEIDDQGRYKVKLPFDVGTKKGLASSRWIRMGQAYAGSGYGTHSPQHKGTEVLISHIDGNPDRPIIVSAVPNAVTPGPVTSKNATQSVTQTASGIRIEIEDKQG